MPTENKLTDKRLRALKATDAEQTIGDGGGLWVRVLPASKGGAINFYYRFTVRQGERARERRFNCGTYPQTSLAEARTLRNQARSKVRAGLDPVDHQESERRAAAAAQALAKMEGSVTDLFIDWKRVYLNTHHNDRGAYAEALFQHDVQPVIGSMKAKDVRLPHVVQVIDRALDRGVRRKANVVLSNLRQMFRHGLGRGLVETDPTLGISKKQAGGKETPSERHLSYEEVKELDGRLTKCGLHPRVVAAIRLILATGVRVGELIKAKWTDLDLEANTWTIPADNSKNGRSHLIHLSTYARHQIDQLAAVRSGDFILAGRDPKTHMSDKGISKAVRDRIRDVPLRRRTPLTRSLMLSGGEWSPHDLRRTMASRMGDLGVAPHVIERCLNHVQQGIVGVYQKQDYLEERQAAFMAWGKRLEELTGAAEATTEVPGDGR